MLSGCVGAVADARVVVVAGVVGLVDLTLGTISMILHQLVAQINQYIFGSLRV